jgi:uncharacterized protein (DUF2236 family)
MDRMVRDLYPAYHMAATAILPAPEDVADLVPRPGSVTWRIAGDGRLLAGAGYALLLQVAHPVVGAGVAQHSDYRNDPWGRLWRTLDYVNLTIFGGPEAAAEIGRRTREMHKRIKGVRPDGERYHALEPEAFAWVHATLAHSILRSHELFGVRPSAWERERFYADWRRVGRLIGVRERDLPAGLGAFNRYFDAMVDDVLVDNETVHGVLETLVKPARPDVPLLPEGAWKVLRVPAARGGLIVTSGMLGPKLRARFGLPWTRSDAVQFNAIAAASRASGPVLPRRLRAFGPTYLDWRRDAIRATGIAV